MQDYRKLKITKKAMALAVAVRDATSEMPRRGYRPLHSQAARAAESIIFNIAEGCGANSQNEMARFLGISIRSCSELQSQLELGKEYGLLAEKEWESLDTRVAEVRKMLYSLRQRVLGSASDDSPPRG